jgi:hypothetical protein
MKGVFKSLIIPIPKDVFQISQEQINNYNAFYQRLEREENGRIAGKIAAPFFAKSGLGMSLLKRIWNLVDTEKKGSLEEYYFYVGLHLITMKLKYIDLEIPQQLPNSLIKKEKKVVEDLGFDDDFGGFGSEEVQNKPSEKTISNVSIMMNECKLLNEEMMSVDQEIEENKTKYVELKKEEEDLRNIISNLKQELGQKQSQRLKLLGETSQLNMKIEIMKEEDETKEVILNDVKNEIERLTKLKQVGEENLKRLKDSIVNTNFNGEVDNLDKLKVDVLNLKNEIVFLKEKSKETDIENKLFEKDKLFNEINQLEESKTKLETDIKVMEAKNIELNEYFEENRIVKENLINENKILNEKYEELRNLNEGLLKNSENFKRVHQLKEFEKNIKIILDEYQKSLNDNEFVSSINFNNLFQEGETNKNKVNEEKKLENTFQNETSFQTGTENISFQNDSFDDGFGIEVVEKKSEPKVESKKISGHNRPPPKNLTPIKKKESFMNQKSKINDSFNEFSNNNDNFDTFDSFAHNKNDGDWKDFTKDKNDFDDFEDFKF